MGTNERYQARSLEPMIRWAAFGGIALMVARKFVYLMFPGFLPSSAWRPESWGTGLLISAVFELVLLTVLAGIPFCIYFYRLRRGNSNARDLAIDCGAAVGLYLTALFLL